MADDQINARVGIDLKKQIQNLVDKGDYKDITSFIEIAIKSELDIPKREREFKERTWHLIEDDSEVRRAIWLVCCGLKANGEDNKKMVKGGVFATTPLPGADKYGNDNSPTTIGDSNRMRGHR